MKFKKFLFKASRILRCPLCRDGGQPAHVGLNVMFCELCGQSFIVQEVRRKERKLAERAEKAE
ncbi:MAG: hypothetical protein HYT65_01215 [Candidatus Yanofskybacteria bacterium]|nr:hypothetical protein [Candidatus Yanofskybacteria bacterium]